MNRRCSLCGEIKSLEDFHYKNKKKGTRGYWCASCRKEYDKRTRKNRYYNLRSKKKESNDI